MAEDLQTQIEELKDRILNLESLLSLGAELMSQLSVDAGCSNGIGPHGSQYGDYSKLCEEILLSEKNKPKSPHIDGRGFNS